jgi:hypothetical protein
MTVTQMKSDTCSLPEKMGGEERAMELLYIEEIERGASKWAYMNRQTELMNLRNCILKNLPQKSTYLGILNAAIKCLSEPAPVNQDFWSGR